MRRPAHTMPVSPQQLKHFAAATLAITALLAIFAGGDNVGLSSDLQAREARNQLIEAETAKLGTKHLKAHLKLGNSSRSQFSFSDGGEVVDMAGEWGGGGGGAAARPGPRDAKEATSMSRRLPKTIGQSVSIAGPEGVPDGAKPKDQRAKMNPKKAAEEMPAAEPSKEELDRAMEASRQRSRGGEIEPGGD